MKFAHEYKDYLEHSGFPVEWVNSALSYGQLKKCIKKVKRELASIGLDPTTLQELLESDEKRRASIARREEEGAEPESEHKEHPVRYEFVDKTTRGGVMETGTSTSQQAYVRPMLLFLVDDQTGEPFDARLAPETKTYIHKLALNARLTDVSIEDAPEVTSDRSSTGSPENGFRRPSRAHRLIEVPLTTDTEFFDLLQNELSSIAKLQDSERAKLHGDITTVGQNLAKATDPQDKKGKKDLARWRKLFELYVDSRVFFATNEQDHGLHNFASAQKRYMLFIEKAQELGLLTKFKNSASAAALQSFLAINSRLLQNIRFVEINQTAMTKILKKFDKRTALSIKSTFPTSLPKSLLTVDIAKSLSAQVSTDIMSVVPSLDDYLCPICSELAWRPVRLRCQHTYCIRCLIRLQRLGEGRCPLCREDGAVMMADSRYIDPNLIAFLKKYFPDEVKAKQKLNERMALVDKFGEEYVDAKCTLM
ncbi:RING-14 protein [Venturia nashicola]|uniref:RING-14 protein n=1 Tax=Venturia nashicola TaxID=86259 RepID=A0A4Z1NU74_9PEZI|nr:RING-14 protein [Venturia nashicola]